ncbi:hypothetical protein MSP8886_03296 [Marinomonas spartinae]|uniref:Uncharacterized protein n=1 Tax=Marinomonas spartinae TaxID=1792290 RepID=A0A1A8TQ12_9GAMM|nr:hypothetical protein [Marinomonas spartinae]SBS35171.1 hypothetical protein MSP8886_03296 [Marinomonas spartinae]
MKITYEESVPSPQEFCEMRVKAGLSAKSIKAATIACMAFQYDRVGI